MVLLKRQTVGWSFVIHSSDYCCSEIMVKTCAHLFSIKTYCMSWLGLGTMTVFWYTVVLKYGIKNHNRSAKFPQGCFENKNINILGSFRRRPILLCLFRNTPVCCACFHLTEVKNERKKKDGKIILRLLKSWVNIVLTGVKTTQRRFNKSNYLHPPSYTMVFHNSV